MIKDNQKLLNLFHIVIDGLIIVFSFIVSYILRFDAEKSFLILLDYIDEPLGSYKSLSQYSQMLIFLVPCYILSYYFFNLYNPKRSKGRRTEFFNLLKANILGLVYCTSALYFLKDTNYARLFLGIFFIVNITLDFIFRLILSFILKSIRRRGMNLKHMLLIGYSRATENYIDRILSHPEWGYFVHGILDDTVTKEKTYRNIEVVGKISELKEFLDENEYDEIAITLSISEYEKLEGIVALTEKSGVHTKFIPDYNNIIPTKPYTEDLDGIPVIHVRNVPLSNSFNRVFKRLVDIMGALGCILIFSIPMGIVALLIKITSPGPLIYRQTRVGLHNKEFDMFKFRSMKVQSAEKEKKAWTTVNDPRVTSVGKFIRSTSLDELPQFFNVLRGEMSLVGPRPERPFFVEKFKEEVPRYMIKHQVRPGITGWAQINGYRGDTSIRMRINCDLYYIENWTMSLDFKILILTVFKGFINKNAY